MEKVRSAECGVNDKKLLERLVQVILDVIDKPHKIQKTTHIGTLF